MYGVGNDTVGFNYYPFDSSGVGNNIEIIGNATQITVTNHTGITFNVTYIVVEFLKN